MERLPSRVPRSHDALFAVINEQYLLTIESDSWLNCVEEVRVRLLCSEPCRIELDSEDSSETLHEQLARMQGLICHLLRKNQELRFKLASAQNRKDEPNSRYV